MLGLFEPHGPFGRARNHEPPLIERAPDDAEWRKAWPKGEERVRAWLAREDCEVMTARGQLKARRGKDVIVGYAPRDMAVVRRDLFERTYKKIGHGMYRKRTDVPVRYFVLDSAARVKTLEGDQPAQAGDWVVEGVDGELWPVSREKAARKYRTR